MHENDFLSQSLRQGWIFESGYILSHQEAEWPLDLEDIKALPGLLMQNNGPKAAQENKFIPH